MRKHDANPPLRVLLVAAIAVLIPCVSPAQDATAVIARLPDGKPDLSGNWTIAASLNDLSANIVRIGDTAVAEDARVIPYTPVYAQLRAETESRMYEEPELHCYMAGVPSHMWRQAYSGAGLVVQQNADHIVFLNEFQGARRIVSFNQDSRLPEAVKLFMGHGVAHWDGDTLVIETTNHNAITWLDLAGNRHSDAFVVTERFTPVDNDNYTYEATFEDPEAYTQSWTIATTIRMPKSSNSRASRATPTRCITPRKSAAVPASSSETLRGSVAGAAGSLAATEEQRPAIGERDVPSHRAQGPVARLVANDV
jgi:hypothetical protein